MPLFVLQTTEGVFATLAPVQDQHYQLNTHDDDLMTG
jgi:hypothetical protein